jgi:4-amino-4-deoxy-L-arabinose transferase-like glycosyltransferase
VIRRAAARVTEMAAFIVTIGIVCLLYVAGLSHAPVYFGGDEAQFGVVAHSIAETGRTLRGDFLPLMVNLADPLGTPPPPWGGTWYQPFLFYFVALVLKVLPLTEWTVRLPAALLGGVVTPVFVYLVARRLIGSVTGAAAATLVLALSPAHMIMSRQARDYIAPVAFTAAWLFCLWRSIDTGRQRWALATGLVPGLGLFSHISSWLLMPMYAALSVIVLTRRSMTIGRTAAAAIAGFAIPATFLVVWVMRHPEMLRQTSAAYEMAGAQRPPIFDVSGAGVVTAAKTFATFFDPFGWFVFGGPSLTTSTGRAGVFLVPVAMLFPIGLYVLWQRRRQEEAYVLLAGLFAAVLPAALRGEGWSFQRALCMIVFVALIAGFGMDRLWQSQSRWIRWLAAGVAVASLVQFGVFYRDYFTHYKLRSAFYYDPVAFVNVAEFLLREPDSPAYYFNTELDDPAAKWRFYATKAGRTEVLSRTHYVGRDRFPLHDAPPGSFCVVYVDQPTLDPLLSSGAWRILARITDVDNREAAAILRKER